MKATFACLLALALIASAQAQTQYTPEQLDQLLAPIALYPDPLVALILPASTAPADVTSAAQYLAGGGNPAGIDSQPWDASVKGLAHYPDVVKWMNDNADWMHALGAAFAMQPSDVMQSVQQLRAKARAAGTLTNTPQQQVDMEGDDIRIVPTQPDTIYVPDYDSDDVYDIPDGYAGPFITFGMGYPVGPWLGYECDWDDFGIWVGPWQPGWAYRRGWADSRLGGNRWHVDPRRGHQLVRNYFRPGAGLPSAHYANVSRAPAPGRGPVSGFHPSSAPSAPRPDYRGYGGEPARPETRAPSSPVFGGHSRGTQVRSYSNRGQSSRQAPVRGSAPARGAAPSGGRDRH
jgi:hypothetical protein